MAKKVPRVWPRIWTVQYVGSNDYGFTNIFATRKLAEGKAKMLRRYRGPDGYFLSARVVELVPKTKGEAR